MGIVLGKPTNYKRGITASAVRRIANEEYSAKRKRNTPKRNTRRTNTARSNNENPRNSSEMDDIPDDIKDMMKEMGLDPEDPADIEEFIEKTQGGGRRKKHRTRR